MVNGVGTIAAYSTVMWFWSPSSAGASCERPCDDDMVGLVYLVDVERIVTPRRKERRRVTVLYVSAHEFVRKPKG